MFDSKNLQYYLKCHENHYYVDLQIISVIFIKCKHFQNKQFSLTNNIQFIKYFYKSWNLQVISPKDVQIKKQAISAYIKWKFVSASKVPDDWIFEIIQEIYIKYNENRNNIISEIKRSQINCKKLHLEFENFIFCFLQFHYTKDYFLIENTIDIQVFSKTLEEKFHLDHIIELEIVKAVLKRNKINNMDLVIKFIKYFNIDWNFQVIKKKYNIYKHKKVIEWLNWICDSSDEIYENLDSAPIKEIFLIFQMYKSNRHHLKSLISNDLSLNRLQRKTFLSIEIDLSNLLKSIISEEPQFECDRLN